MSEDRPELLENVQRIEPARPLVRGEIERGEASSAKLLDSSSPKGPVSLRFPSAALDVLFPNLYAPAMADPESIDEQLRHAIDDKRLVEVGYNGKRRVVEPHDYGVHKGMERLLVYQLRSVPASSDRRATGWRLLDVAKIQSCSVLNESFRGSRGQAHRNHLKWEILYARVGS